MASTRRRIALRFDPADSAITRIRLVLGAQDFSVGTHLALVAYP